MLTIWSKYFYRNLHFFRPVFIILSGTFELGSPLIIEGKITQKLQIVRQPLVFYFFQKLKKKAVKVKKNHDFFIFQTIPKKHLGYSSSTPSFFKKKKTHTKKSRGTAAIRFKNEKNISSSFENSSLHCFSADFHETLRFIWARRPQNFRVKIYINFKGNGINLCFEFF